MRAWEWIDFVEEGYVVWRLEMDGADDQLCIYTDGTIEVRQYNHDGEDECWQELPV
jgi:hypothetical protein